MGATGGESEPAQRTPLDLQLQRDESAPGVARAAVAGLCEQAGVTGVPCHTLLLLVSEIVTNAVVHSKASSGTPIRFTVEVKPEHVRVDVHDGGPDFAPPAGRPELGGWGLRLLDREARDWGVHRSEGTLVWFELALDARPEGSVL
jgi:anti-sigma regulatory factor (Ser/Thr protein kinase)